MAQSYRDLLTWQKAMGLVTNIYRATRAFLKRNSTASQASSAEQQYRCQATSPKGKLGGRDASFTAS